MSKTVGTLVDLNRYPLDSLDSERGPTMVNTEPNWMGTPHINEEVYGLRQ